MKTTIYAKLRGPAKNPAQADSKACTVVVTSTVPGAQLALETIGSAEHKRALLDLTTKHAIAVAAQFTRCIPAADYGNLDVDQKDLEGLVEIGRILQSLLADRELRAAQATHAHNERVRRGQED